jgi:hypothetical protein
MVLILMFSLTVDAQFDFPKQCFSRSIFLYEHIKSSLKNVCVCVCVCVCVLITFAHWKVIAFPSKLNK